jgi:predicted transcriptional regulator
VKVPSFQFYPGDWRKDPGVQALSYHDRGVWFEMLLLMHESEERGKLLLNAQPMPVEALARLLGLDIQILNQTLTTLLSYGVASRDEETGAICNRRMVRDEKVRQLRSECGKLGGNPNLLHWCPN